LRPAGWAVKGEAQAVKGGAEGFGRNNITYLLNRETVMNRKLLWKTLLICVLLVLAVLLLYPPQATLKPGIDLAGGTSMIYEIDTQGLTESQKRNLAQDMIKVLRRRIDPANIQNLIWRPQGSNRFEIQMPLASAGTRDKRWNFETAQRELLGDKWNIDRAKVLPSLQKPAEARTKDFEDWAHSDPNRLGILQALAKAYDERKELEDKRDQLRAELEDGKSKMSSAGLDLEQIEENVNGWAKLEEEPLTDALKSFLESEEHLELLSGYVKTYDRWSKAEDELLEPVTGKKALYNQAERAIDALNLSEDQLNLVLEMPKKSKRRAEAIAKLKAKFADRVREIDRVVAAFDEYRPVRGILDDATDLQRMLKGAGVLEFRLLPTKGHPEVDSDQMEAYVAALKEKGPGYDASEGKYIWCEIEDPEGWNAADEQDRVSYTAQFGGKTYVLASNQKNACVLQGPDKRDWKLEKAQPSTDQLGQRAIGFRLDERGGNLFANVTARNIGRPLCIVLDGIAISAPKIESRIRRDGIITGRFTETEVGDMVNKLNAGSLPSKLIEQPISVKTIGPSIGADNRDQGIRAGFIGLVAVMLTMLIYYTLAGSIADVALLMNILFVLAMMAWVRATFTLPGIAGIILTIGMSVDANVLIFERIREEQQKGSSLRIAIANGYQRAFRTILDANLTTFITAAILYWVASEEIKGFAIVLMLGIVWSMFTALFVTRTVFDLLLANRIIKDHLFMLQLIRKPNVNWMKLRPIFLGMSAVLIAAGLIVFFTRDDAKNNKYDIEFTGGTNIQVNLKEGVNLSRQDVEDRIQRIGKELKNPALAAANVYSIGKSGRQYEINTTETNKITATVTFPQPSGRNASAVASAIRKTQSQGRFSSVLSNLIVREEPNNPARFVVATSQMNQSLVADVLNAAFPDANVSELEVEETVNSAVLAAFENELEIQRSLQPKITSQEQITQQLIDSYPELADFRKGIKITCDVERAVTSNEFERRLQDLRFKPDTRALDWEFRYKILDSNLNQIKQEDANEPLTSFAYVSVEAEAAFRELSEEEWTRFAENERKKVLAAGELETSLPRVRQFDPSVGAEARTRALIAIILSLSAIVLYIWVRFGNVRYGVAAITALVHDVCITLGAITACTYIASSVVGEKLLIGDFKINLAMIAAFLTLIGYSLNDTIVVFDRIRENRHKAQLKPQTVTDSINQTISRTILTSFTTFIVVLVMYIFGGPNLRGFTFAIGLGVIIGTYSSIAIAAPILLIGAKIRDTKKK
jgi:SecD/SecF fusion protein